jgi:hypothetical protein
MGFTWLPVLPREPVSSYLTISPLPFKLKGGLLSVALSLELPPPGVTRHPALWSSDFPPALNAPAIASPSPDNLSYKSFVLKKQGWLFLEIP